METKHFNVEIKSVEEKDDGGSIIAYASTFDRIPDSYGDVVAPGAFAKSLENWRASGNPIPLLFGHRTDDPHMNIGAVYDYEEDMHGLKVYARFDAESETAQYCRKLVREGRLSKLSFAFAIKDYSIVDIEGKQCKELRELDIYEVSLVPIPANQFAEVIDVKDGEDIAENAAAPVINDHSDELTDEIKEINQEEITQDEETVEECEAQLADVIEAIKNLRDYLAPAIESLTENIKSFYDVITAGAPDEVTAVLANSEQNEIKESISEVETADVQGGPVDEAEEKGAPDEELLAKIYEIFKLGA